ncbi:MAG: hypothetical protein ABIJ09_05105 [Pseudomonadota bacterium]
MTRPLTLATIAALALGALMLSARPAQAQVYVRPAGQVSIHAHAPQLVLPLFRASYYGGDLAMFYDAGNWWTIVDDQLYVTYQDGDQWLLYYPATVPVVRTQFAYSYAYACYQGYRSACRQWHNQVRYDVRNRPVYRQAQYRYWQERERSHARHPSQYARVNARPAQQPAYQGSRQNGRNDGRHDERNKGKSNGRGNGQGHR